MMSVFPAFPFSSPLSIFHSLFLPITVYKSERFQRCFCGYILACAAGRPAALALWQCNGFTFTPTFYTIVNSTQGDDVCYLGVGSLA